MSNTLYTIAAASRITMIRNTLSLDFEKAAVSPFCDDVVGRTSSSIVKCYSMKGIESTVSDAGPGTFTFPTVTTTVQISIQINKRPSNSDDTGTLDRQSHLAPPLLVHDKTQQDMRNLWTLLAAFLKLRSSDLPGYQISFLEGAEYSVSESSDNTSNPVKGSFVHANAYFRQTSLLTTLPGPFTALCALLIPFPHLLHLTLALYFEAYVSTFSTLVLVIDFDSHQPEIDNSSGDIITRFPAVMPVLHLILIPTLLNYDICPSSQRWPWR
ncbi:hypothetical protein IW261DRAFT_1566516 [Armillaria novae-zelandiae]|uniref:Uncharacterized protein n=1 Tax=Armillaria novae-zelandiae TaxID=153914 RepID=A0AA39P3T3_9AGAR|nr:hypothetical protein IW261DRAFT_1566516 [Armillaria novae-zelandiae]